MHVLPWVVFTAVVLAALILAAAPGRASAMSPKVNVTRKAEVIAEGKVTGIRSAWDRSHRLIYTTTTLRVDKELKGEVPSYVTIKQVGGRVGKLRLIVSEQPEFAAGERVKVYLTEESANEFELVPVPAAKAHLGGPVPVVGKVAAGYIWDGTKWDAADLPMEYWVNTAFNSGENSVLQSAFATWEDDAGSSMDYTYRGTTTRSAPTYDNYNVMTKGSTGGSIATTYYWAYGTQIVEADIVYDYNAYPWSTSGESGKMDLQNIATHEDGHTLVLSDMYDAENSNETMYGYASYGETKKRTLGPGDIAGIAVVYPGGGGGGGGAPPDVGNFTAAAGDQQVDLSWTNPASGGFAGVLIVRKAGSAPADRTDGSQICSGAGTSWNDPGLTNGTTYYYKAFSFNAGMEYSTGVTANATPLALSTMAATAGSTTIDWGESTRIEATLSPGHSPAPSVTVDKSTNGTSWQALGQMSHNDGLGVYEATVTPSARSYYRARWAGDADHLSAVSPQVIVYVRPAVSAKASRSWLHRGWSVSTTGYMSPGHEGLKVAFYYERYSAGAWRWYASRYARMSRQTWSRGKAVSTFYPSAKGRYRVRFRAGDSDHLATSVYTRTFTVL